MKSPIRWIVSILTLAAFMLPHSFNFTHAEAPRFQLVILKQNWFDLGLGYDYDSAFPELEEANLSDPLFVISENEIEAYDWACQSITLTPAATTDLISALPIDEDRQAGIQDLTRLKESLGYGNPIELALYIHSFVLQVDAETLYGGIFLDAVSQMAIDYPVIRVELVQGKALLHVLPVHVPFVSYDPVGCDNPSWDDAIAPEVAGDWAQFPEDMKAAFEAFANTETAETFRALLRDERIFEIIQDAGKLTE